MPKVLDLFCGGGGASKGYALAGFDVTGVDICDQPFYPFPFIRANALDVDLDGFDLIHASPPCPLYSLLQLLWANKVGHDDTIIGKLRDKLQDSGKWFVVENVPQAPLHKDVMLCGSMFGLKVRRHRIFESNFLIDQPKCNHKSQGYVVGVYGHPGGSSRRDSRKFGTFKDWRDAMQIDWLPQGELAQAIPPAYTKYIGEEFLRDV